MNGQQNVTGHEMPSALPGIMVGAGSLALLAGYINVVMLGFFQVPVSHMSGAVSQLGIDVANGYWQDLWLVGSIVFGFFVGAFISGLFIGTTHLELRRRYGVALMLQALLLALATMAAQAEFTLSVTLAATACGLQNAMASSYRGLILRTTHVTGIVTDLGALLGNRWRQRHVHGWKFALLLTLLFGFFLGGFLGAWCFQWVGMKALGFAAIGSFILGGCLVLWLHFCHQRKVS